MPVTLWAVSLSDAHNTMRNGRGRATGRAVKTASRIDSTSARLGSVYVSGSDSGAGSSVLTEDSSARLTLVIANAMSTKLGH